MDIHKGLGNANKIMNRLLFDGFDNFGCKLPLDSWWELTQCDSEKVWRK
jgi:hypothetical protein